jgi:hypothetical protein
MNSTSCHPEQSLAKSEAIRQTQSKDPYSTVTANSAGCFRITVRFFEELGTEQSPIASHEAGPYEGQAHLCQGIEKKASNPVGITRIAFNTNDVTTILQ